MIRAKVKVRNVLEHFANGDDVKTQEQLYLSAVYSDDKESENYSFSQSTPHLVLNMSISNPNAFGKLIKDKEYYLDFIPVEN